MSIEWTAAHRAAWEQSWSEPHMQTGLLLIKEKLWPNVITVPAGHDALQVSAAAHHCTVGNNQVFNLIETLKTQTTKQKPLPEPNTPAARGIEVKKPE